MTADELVKLREHLGWTRAEMARRLKMSPSRYQDYELGHTRGYPPRPATIDEHLEAKLRRVARGVVDGLRQGGFLHEVNQDEASP